MSKSITDPINTLGALEEGVGGAANELIISGAFRSWQRILVTNMSIGGSSGEWGWGACAPMGLAGMCKTCRRNVVALINIRDNNGNVGQPRPCPLPASAPRLKVLIHTTRTREDRDPRFCETQFQRPPMYFGRPLRLNMRNS